MAIINKKKVFNERVFQCDKCKRTEPMSLRDAFRAVCAGTGKSWLFMENDRVLCPDCLKAIIDAWYNQQEVGNFQLSGSVEESKSRKRQKRVVA